MSAMKKTFIWALSILLFTFVSCAHPSNVDSEITSVVYANLSAAEAEKLDAYVATIHEQSLGYAETRRQMEQIFEIYDLKYTIEDIKIVEKSDQEAKVECVQVTKKIKGPEFKDNRVKVIHTLKKSGEKWKLFKSDLIKIDYL